MPSLWMSRIIESDTTLDGRVTLRAASHIPASTRIWTIVGSVAGILVLGACIALVAVCTTRRRSTKQALEEEGRQRDPCLGQNESRMKRRVTRDTMELEAESQRDAMILKSLASRSGHSLSSQSASSMMSMEQTSGSRFFYGHRLANNEAFENRLTQSRSKSGLDVNKNWEGQSKWPDIPSCILSRSSSPKRSPQQMVLAHPVLPPLLEQHPLFRNTSDESDLEEEAGHGRQD